MYDIKNIKTNNLNEIKNEKEEIHIMCKKYKINQKKNK